jgi:integrase
MQHPASDRSPQSVNAKYPVFLAPDETPAHGRLRFHDLRNGAASLLLAQWVHPRVVMELLGHSQMSLTLGTYSHVIPQLSRDAADRMDHILARH